LVLVMPGSGEARAARRAKADALAMCATLGRD
jgi:hypothetical protein